MVLRTVAIVLSAVVALSACDGKTAAQNHRDAAGEQTAGGFKEGVGGLIGDKSLQKAGEAQSDRGRTNEKVGDFKDAVHKALH
jgi:uncharacterized protein YjbJ (UPF0337 family)